MIPQNMLVLGIWPTSCPPGQGSNSKLCPGTVDRTGVRVSHMGWVLLDLKALPALWSVLRLKLALEKACWYCLVCNFWDNLKGTLVDKSCFLPEMTWSQASPQRPPEGWMCGMEGGIFTPIPPAFASGKTGVKKCPLMSMLSLENNLKKILSR